MKYLKQFLESYVGTVPEIACRCGISESAVYGWFRVDRIPAKHYEALITFAGERGVHLDRLQLVQASLLAAFMRAELVSQLMDIRDAE